MSTLQFPAAADKKLPGQGWAIVVGLALAPLCYYVTARVAATLWRWFVVAVFPQLPALATSQIVGLLLLRAVLAKYDRPPANVDVWKEVWMMVGQSIVLPLLILGAAVVVRWAGT